MIINENSKFYGIGYENEKGTMRRIPIQSEKRNHAETEAIEYCKLNNMRFDKVYPNKNKQRQGNSVTKFARYRKQNQGKNPPEYFSAL
jgi:hypothetical protein